MKKRKQGDYKIPFRENGDLMTYEQGETLSAKNYNESTGDVEIFIGYIDGKDQYKLTNINKIKNLEKINKTNWGGEDSYYIKIGPDMRENTPFYAILTYNGYSRGRSAADLEFLDDSGHKYSMFMSSFNELLFNSNIIDRKTELITWNFCKKGSNYGLQFLNKVC